jgi:hypothetical protein
MGFSKSGTKTSVASFFTNVVERMLGPEVVPVEKKTLNLAQKRANIRAAGVREGFRTILARGDEMAQRIETYKKQRNGNGPSQPAQIDPPDAPETIVLSSADAPSPRQANMVRTG